MFFFFKIFVFKENELFWGRLNYRELIKRKIEILTLKYFALNVKLKLIKFGSWGGGCSLNDIKDF